ncbi:hypothetical protein NDU88_006728 [Pleurodeles waltl]|uniref:Uncharacterized protein n=1 Tax=Pleurodeles waltl TaxID=8319 RepID=A0AAV7PM81_PLEWA|nr:hypothetical protein NDU88_006728 [Pleurodeles waltl]
MLKSLYRKAVVKRVEHQMALAPMVKGVEHQMALAPMVKGVEHQMALAPMKDAKDQINELYNVQTATVRLGVGLRKYIHASTARNNILAANPQ